MSAAACSITWGMKYLYAVEMSDAWETVRNAGASGPLRTEVAWIYLPNHSLVDDQMDGVSELRPGLQQGLASRNTRPIGSARR